MSLEAKNLNFSYTEGQPILKNLTLSIPPKQITALIGRNGCGKSTLLKLLNGLLTPNAGSIKLGGRELSSIPKNLLAQSMAHLAQSSIAPNGLTVRELVDFGRHPYKGFLGRSSSKDEDAVSWALSETSLTKLADRELNTLSGGQRQRAWIALTLAQDTEFLLLDEPTTYLDIAHQIEVLELLARLNEEQKKTIVMVVHDPNHASQYAHHVACLADGVLLKEGEPSKIFTVDNVRELFSVEPLIFEGKHPEKPWCVPHHSLSSDDNDR